MICKYCGKANLVETDFEIANVIKGVVYRRKKCKACKQKTQRDRIHTQRTWINDYKASRGCKICNITDYRVLQFHHRDKEAKEFTIGNYSKHGSSRSTLMKEIEKCDILCANCHIITHYEERK